MRGIEAVQVSRRWVTRDTKALLGNQTSLGKPLQATWGRDGTAIGGRGRVLTFLARPLLADRTPYLAQCRRTLLTPFFPSSSCPLALQTIGAKSNSVSNDSCTSLNRRAGEKKKISSKSLASICRVRPEPGSPVDQTAPKLEGRALLRTARVLRRARPPRLHQESQKREKGVTRRHPAASQTRGLQFETS